jgi:hypothetical protein
MPQTGKKGDNIFYEGIDMESFFSRLEEACLTSDDEGSGNSGDSVSEY